MNEPTQLRTLQELITEVELEDGATAFNIVSRIRFKIDLLTEAAEAQGVELPDLNSIICLSDLPNDLDDLLTSLDLI